MTPREAPDEAWGLTPSPAADFQASTFPARRPHPLAFRSMRSPQRIIHGGGAGGQRRSALWALGFSGLCLCGLVALSLVVLASGPVPFTFGVVLGVLPVPVLVAAVLALDRLEPEPTRRLVLSFAWGAGLAVLLAGVINQLGMSLTTDILGQQEGRFVSAAVGAPIVEEILKGAVLFGFLWFGRREVDGPTDGIVYAGMVGIGFAMTENILYYASAAAQQGLAALVGTFVLRGIVSPLAHPLFTSMLGIGLGYAALQRGKARRVAVPLIGLLAAMVLHGFWNAAASTNLLVLAFYYLVVLVPVLFGVVIVTLADRARMVRVIARQLPQYDEHGLVSSGDVGMLSKLSNRRRARFWARSHGGSTAWRAMRDYQLAATELALLEDRVERGVADNRVVPRRRESLLRLMGAARQAFLRPVYGASEPPQPPWTRPTP